MEFQSRNMQEQEEIRKMLLTECEQCRVHSDQQPRNDKLIAHWGAMLLQLAVITEDVPGKHELLKDSRAKLQRAIDINPNSITPDGQLCLFHVRFPLCLSPSCFLVRIDTLSRFPFML